MKKFSHSAGKQRVLESKQTGSIGTNRLLEKFYLIFDNFEGNLKNEDDLKEENKLKN